MRVDCGQLDPSTVIRLYAANGTVGASDGALDGSQGRVDPLKGGHQGGAATRSGNDRVMDAPGCADASETAQAITDDRAGGIEIARRQGRNLGAAEAFHAA